VVANGDDPLVVGAVGQAPRVVWVGAGAEWQADALVESAPPPLAWTVRQGTVHGPEGATPVQLRLPGRFNLGNAAMTLATAAALGVPPAAAAAAIAGVTSIAGRYSVIDRGPHTLRLLLAKNPAGWSELLPLLADARAVLLVINAHDADGRDTSWLWDVPFERLAAACVVASGERAADVGLRLSYAGIEHRTEPDPLAALELMPPGEVQVVANYTAFLGLRRRLSAGVHS
jgi:UDP-N-acetylmuramyl tripeptide synthase